MEINILRNFLTVAREGNMTRASEILHISQPSLSLQMKKLEEELDKKLFIRHSRSLSLTDEGLLLKNRANDILEMVDKTEAEFHEMNNLKGGDVRIGAAESYLIKYIAVKLKLMKKDYPLFHFHIISGDSDVVLDRLDRGLVDFAVIVEPPSLDKYNYVKLPGHDKWGAYLLPSDPLSSKASLEFNDLVGRNIICSEQSVKNDMPRWCGNANVEKLTFIGYSNLAYNGGICAEEGLGILLSFEHLFEERSNLVFRPLAPELTNDIYLVYKKYQILTPISEAFLELFI